MTFSLDTLSVFKELLDTVQVPLSHPEFEVLAAKAAKAKNELAEAIAKTPPESS